MQGSLSSRAFSWAIPITDCEIGILAPSQFNSGSKIGQLLSVFHSFQYSDSSILQYNTTSTSWVAKTEITSDMTLNGGNF